MLGRLLQPTKILHRPLVQKEKELLAELAQKTETPQVDEPDADEEDETHDEPDASLARHVYCLRLDGAEHKLDIVDNVSTNKN